MDFTEHLLMGNYDDVNLMSMPAWFDMTNNAESSKKLVIA